MLNAMILCSMDLIYLLNSVLYCLFKCVNEAKWLAFDQRVVSMSYICLSVRFPFDYSLVGLYDVLVYDVLVYDVLVYDISRETFSIEWT